MYYIMYNLCEFCYIFFIFSVYFFNTLHEL